MALTADQLNDLRKRVLENAQYSLEELTAAVRQLVAERLSSFEKPAKGKSTAKSVNLDDLI